MTIPWVCPKSKGRIDKKLRKKSKKLGIFAQIFLDRGKKPWDNGLSS
jgi:hypothetical protein